MGEFFLIEDHVWDQQCQNGTNLQKQSHLHIHKILRIAPNHDVIGFQDPMLFNSVIEGGNFNLGKVLTLI